VRYFVRYVISALQNTSNRNNVRLAYTTSKECCEIEMTTVKITVTVVVVRLHTDKTYHFTYF